MPVEAQPKAAAIPSRGAPTEMPIPVRDIATAADERAAVAESSTSAEY